MTGYQDFIRKQNGGRPRRKKTPSEKRRSENTRLKNVYNITIEHKETMFHYQDSKCLICEKRFKNISGAHVDHNHQTGKVRGLLCQKCNWGLGNFEDNKYIIMRAGAYLEKYE